MTTKHSAYELEQKRLDETIDLIDKEVDWITEEIKDPTDDYVKQIVNAGLAKTLIYLQQSRLKPYFGRVDFMKDETYETDSVYIGKRGVVSSDTMDSIVVDWRAPVASLYYSGESKDAFYRTPQGIVRGEVKLKRNFAIEEGKITGIYDGAVKETINREMSDPDDFLDEGYIDEFLSASLDQTNDSRLKDIVATIQSEQNDIIRAEKDRPILVQGVAGSGKTTIALHRLSYLIYNYQDSLASKRFMVFAPNRLFLTYISEVLPELGVEDVQQSTFMDWAAKLVKPLMNKGWRILDPNKPLQLFFEEGENREAQRREARHRMHLKGSLSCKATLDAYLADLIETQINYKRLSFIYSRTKHVFAIDGSEIKKLFMEHYANLPFRERLVQLRKHLKQQLNKMVYAHLRELKVDLDKQALAKFEKNIDTILDKYFAAWPTLDVFSVYTGLFASQELLEKFAPVELENRAEVLADTARTSAEIFAVERIETEDLAPLLYLQHALEGMSQAGSFDHAVVDEAQDLSALEILIVSLATKRNSVTIVGDIAQGIHAYRGLHSWDELMKGVYAGSSVQFYKLEQSYRSTVEIMTCANEVLAKIDIPDLFLAKPVLRHGTKPLYQHSEKAADEAGAVIQHATKLADEGFRSIAIVAKSMEQCKKLHKQIKAGLPEAVLLSSKDTEFPEGIVVMPAYMTKGLQFDAVILVGADTENYGRNEEDAKLLYVAMTRPVHRLVVLSAKNGLTELLQTAQVHMEQVTEQEV
ncbi:UNVERIFIED_CONTAM: DNA helicase-2/ATP-dependent DNA helicase PcrA [Brevibacillus sp. OAP136]